MTEDEMLQRLWALDNDPASLERKRIALVGPPSDQLDALAYAMGITMVPNDLIPPGKAYLFNAPEIKIKIEQFNVALERERRRFMASAYGALTIPPTPHCIIAIDLAGVPDRPCYRRNCIDRERFDIHGRVTATFYPRCFNYANCAQQGKLFLRKWRGRRMRTWLAIEKRQRMEIPS